LVYVPECSREHPAQAPETVRIPLEEGPEENLCVTLRRKTVAQCTEFLPEFTIIVDFAVENENSLPVVAKKRLFARLEVDDL